MNDIAFLGLVVVAFALPACMSQRGPKPGPAASSSSPDRSMKQGEFDAVQTRIRKKAGTCFRTFKIGKTATRAARFDLLTDATVAPDGSVGAVVVRLSRGDVSPEIKNCVTMAMRKERFVEAGNRGTTLTFTVHLSSDWEHAVTQ